MTRLHQRPVTPEVIRRRRWLVGVAGMLAAGLLVWGVVVLLSPNPKPAPIASSTPPATKPELTAAPVEPTPAPPPSFDKSARSIDDPMSIWVVADKLRPLNPVDFTPPDLVTANVRYAANAELRAEAASAMEQMFATAAAEGAGGMMLQNAFRSYNTQVGLYAGHVQRLGQAQADNASARPGHSEHQTGLSADIMPDNGQCVVTECFAQTSQGVWLAENAWRFGYHLRYPADKTPITGYVFEPWHYRYIGVELATEMRLQGVVTLEEFFGLPAAPSYP